MPERDVVTAVLVEGDSDRLAVETLAARLGHDLAAEGTVVVAIGGAHALARVARRFGPLGSGVRVLGLCDAGEEAVYRRGLAQAHVGAPANRDELERLGFSVCVDDLEDEMLRAVGSSAVQALFESEGDLRAFRTLQGQPAWRGHEVQAQMRRFLGAGARRKHRYGRLLAGAVDLDRVPRPLAGLLDRL